MLVVSQLNWQWSKHLFQPTQSLMYLLGWNYTFGGRSCVLLSLESDWKAPIKAFYLFYSCSVLFVCLFLITLGALGGTQYAFALFMCSLYMYMYSLLFSCTVCSNVGSHGSGSDQIFVSIWTPLFEWRYCWSSTIIDRYSNVCLEITAV